MNFVTPLFANCQVKQACAFKAVICLSSILPQPSGKKPTLKINLKYSVQSSVEHLRTFLTEAHFNTTFSLDFPVYLTLKVCKVSLSFWLLVCLSVFFFFYRSANNPINPQQKQKLKQTTTTTTKPSQKTQNQNWKRNKSVQKKEVFNICKDNHSIKGLKGTN